MSNSEHSEAGDTHRPFRCAFGPVRELDLEWPPSEADLDACAVIQLDNTAIQLDNNAPKPESKAGMTPQATAEVTAGATPEASAQPTMGLAAEAVVPIAEAKAERPTPRRRLKPSFGDCRDPKVAPRIRALVVPMVPLPVPASEAHAESGPSSTSETKAASLGETDPSSLGEMPPIGPPEMTPIDEPIGEPVTASVATVVAAPVAHLVRLSVAGPVHLSVGGAVATPLVRTQPLPFPLVIEAATDPELVGAGRSAWLALFFAAACAIVTVVEYHAIFSLPAETGASVEQPPVPHGLSVADLAPGVPRAVPRQPASSQPADPKEPAGRLEAAAAPPVALVARASAAAPSLVPARGSLSTGRPEPTGRLEPTGRPDPIRGPLPAASVEPRVAVTVRDRGAVLPAAQPERVQASAPARPVPPPALTAKASSPAVLTARAEAAPVLTARAEAPTPAPTRALSPVPSTAPAAATVPPPMIAPEPLAVAPAVRPVAAVLTDAGNGDEADIRTALTRFRTAYSQLNASAARDVWPSVDTRALERAFQSLKSQELRFDSCKMTVTGGRAQAACKGRAVYVPRIGDQSPRITSREWTFELKKADERWTIASARTL